MKTSIVLDTMVTMFSEYCSQPFIIEPVIIEHSDGKTEQTPELKYWEQKVTTYAKYHFKGRAHNVRFSGPISEP